MTATGWGGEDAEAPAMPLSAQLMANRERGPGDALAIAAARGRAVEARELRDEAAAATDPDERAANLIGRGMTPGMITDVGQRLADAEGELAAEREKIAKGERVNARIRGMLERGQIGGLDASRMLDGDFGDLARAEKLERRAQGLRQQLAAAQMMIAPQREQAADPLEAASRHAHDVFVEVTRQRMADAQARRQAPRQARPPFGSASRAGVAVRSEQCVYCTADGVSDEMSYLLHSDPELNVPVTPPGAVITDRYPGESSRSAAGQASRSYAESPRCSDCGYVRCQCGTAGARVPVRPGTPFGSYS